MSTELNKPEKFKVFVELEERADMAPTTAEKGNLTIEGPNSKAAVTISGLQFSIDNKNKLTVQDLEFVHLFFISLDRLQENPDVPESIRKDVEESFLLLTTVLKQVRVETDETRENIVSYEFFLHNLESVSLMAVTPEEKLRLLILQKKSAKDTLTDEEKQELVDLQERTNLETGCMVCC